MKYLIMLLISVNLSAKPFKTPNGTYEHIKKNSPLINSVFARRLAKAIDRSSKRHNIDPKLLSAIIMQESSYRPGMVAGRDYGLTMINIQTIKYFNFDKKRLLKGLRYSVDAGAIVLAEIKRRKANTEKFWWIRYNCGSKSLKRKICQDYKKRVLRWY